MQQTNFFFRFIPLIIDFLEYDIKIEKIFSQHALCELLKFLQTIFLSYNEFPEKMLVGKKFITY